MISNQKELYNCIDEILAPGGYVRKKHVWYRHTPECICFLNVEKSPYGGSYSNLMGCFVKELGWRDDDFPGTEYRNLGFWMDRLGADKDLVDRVFNLDNREFVKDEREKLLRELIGTYAMVFLKEIGTKEGIGKAIVRYQRLIYSTDGELSRLLGVKPPEPRPGFTDEFRKLYFNTELDACGSVMQAMRRLKAEPALRCKSGPKTRSLMASPESGLGWRTVHQFNFSESPIPGHKIKGGYIKLTVDGEEERNSKMVDLDWCVRFTDRAEAENYFEALVKIFRPLCVREELGEDCVKFSAGPPPPDRCKRDYIYTHEGHVRQGIRNPCPLTHFRTPACIKYGR